MSVDDIDLATLEKLKVEYLATLDDRRPEELFMTPREFAMLELDGFIEFLKKRGVA